MMSRVIIFIHRYYKEMIRNLQFKEITYAQLDKDRKRNAVHKGVERCSPGPN